MKSLDVLWKTRWFSSPCEWFRFAFQRSLKSFKMTPWPRLPPKVHLRRKVKYWKCHFLSALHFPEIEGSRFETCRLCRFFSSPWVPIKKQWKSMDNNKNRSKPMNQWKSKEIETILDPQTVYQPQAISSRLQAIGCKHQNWKHVSRIWYVG